MEILFILPIWNFKKKVDVTLQSIIFNFMCIGSVTEIKRDSKHTPNECENWFSKLIFNNNLN